MRLPMNYRYADIMVYLVKRFAPGEQFTSHDVKKEIELPKGALQHLKTLSLLTRVERRVVKTNAGKSRGGNRVVNVYVIPIRAHEYITKRNHDESTS